MNKIISVVSSVFIAVSLLNCRVCAEPAEPEVSAKACVLIEEKTGRRVYEKEPDKKLPMASTTKIMTVLLCLESGGLDDEFVVDSSAVKVEGSSMGLLEGDIVTKRALCYGMMLPSGNDAANSAAVKVGGTMDNFIHMMNERGKKIGMTRTCFATPSGLEGEGHGASAYDMALLAREALRNPDFAEICSVQRAKVRFGNPPYDRWLANTNKLLGMYEGVKGVKTGFTDEAGRCLVSACERGGVSFICVTLNDRNDWNDHISLYDYGFSVIKLSQLYSDDIVQAEVVGGTEEKLPVKAEGTIAFGSDGISESRITSELVLPPFVYAPVRAGDVLGELRYSYDGKYIDSLPVKAMKTVEYYEDKEDKKDRSVIGKIKDFLFNRE